MVVQTSACQNSARFGAKYKALANNKTKGDIPPHAVTNVLSVQVLQLVRWKNPPSPCALFWRFGGDAGGGRGGNAPSYKRKILCKASAPRARYMTPTLKRCSCVQTEQVS